jgi:hypothetical protein
MSARPCASNWRRSRFFGRKSRSLASRPHYPRMTPHSPQQHGDSEPHDCPEHEGSSGGVSREKPHDRAEGGEAGRAKARAGCVHTFSPLFSFRSRSCFSISVALAKKIAGTARNNPPTTGPQTFPATPAATVARPPRKKRKMSSDQRLSLTAENLKRTIIS